MPIEHIEIFEIGEDKGAIALQGAQHRFEMRLIALRALGIAKTAIGEDFWHHANPVNPHATLG
jgi:hypothetical protein